MNDLKRYLNLNADEEAILSQLQNDVAQNSIAQNTLIQLDDYTSLRQTFSRGLKVYESIFEQVLDSLGKQLLAAAGLSFGFNLIISCGVIFRAVFKRQDKSDTTWIDRLKKVMAENDLAHKMRNDFVWFSVNTTLFFITGGISAGIIAVAGFAFDVCHDIYKTWFDLSTHESLKSKIHEQMIRYGASRNGEDNTRRTELCDLHTELTKKIQSVKKNRAYAIGISVMVLVGAILFFFCPPALPLWVGAGLMLSGSIFGRFGSRIKSKISNIYKSLSTKAQTIPENNEDEDYELPAQKKMGYSYSCITQNINKVNNDIKEDTQTNNTRTRSFGATQSYSNARFFSHPTAAPVSAPPAQALLAKKNIGR